MPSITSKLPFPADVVILNRTVAPGETVEVTDEQAAALLEQADNWQPAVKSTTKTPKE